MLIELFSYDPSAIEPEHRDHMARILKARTEYMRAAAEVIDYRARAWAGEEGLEDVAGLKAADLTKVREDYFREMRELVKASVDVEGLMDMVAHACCGGAAELQDPVASRAGGHGH